MATFDKNGYLDIKRLLDTTFPFIFVVGGRGTGKTYGALKCAREQAVNGHKFMLMRRTQTQVDMIAKPDFSPFKSLDDDSGDVTTVERVSKQAYAFYDGLTQKQLGYCVALSTFSNLRGFDASDVDLIIFDEFIPERHEKPIKNEAQAFFNAVETVNRNRELKGDRPVQCILLANANDMGNPLFIELGLVKRATMMWEKSVSEYRDLKRGLMLVVVRESPISSAKRETALYRLTAGSDFERMALDNDFCEQITNIRAVPLKELTPCVTVGEMTVYRHKSAGYYYLSTHQSGSPESYTTSPQDLKRFKVHCSWLWMAYMRKEVYFEEYLCELLLNRYFKA